LFTKKPWWRESSRRKDLMVKTGLDIVLKSLGKRDERFRRSEMVTTAGRKRGEKQDTKEGLISGRSGVVKSSMHH